MKIIPIADTHGLHHQVIVPSGDVLIVAGDICSYGTLAEVEEFGFWLQEQPCTHKIVIAGNHDKPFQSEKESAILALTQADPGIIYLQDSSVNIEGITFHGSPWTPTFMNWYFMVDRGLAIREKWAMIPENTDVLITHGPPATVLDNVRGISEGCVDLLERIIQIRPKYNVFGHIHEGYGSLMRGNITFFNASLCDGRYRPINKPVVFEF
jgi:Icc-related predicted phosphoesterase